MTKANKQRIIDLALADLRRKYPTFPYPPQPKYSDTTANGLTKCITDFLNLSGHQAERISSMGRVIDNRKTVTDVLGRQRTIGSTKYIKGNSTNGTADISATINGKSIKIEVKIGNDRQSQAQKDYQAQIERAGGVYIIAKNFDEFIEWYDVYLK